MLSEACTVTTINTIDQLRAGGMGGGARPNIPGTAEHAFPLMFPTDILGTLEEIKYFKNLLKLEFIIQKTKFLF